MQDPTEFEDLFIDDLKEDAIKLLRTETNTNIHVEYLGQNIACARTNIGRQILGDYGINMLTPNEDMALASYFFVLSSIKTFAPSARDFFLDIMLYCEDSMGPLKNIHAIKTLYEKKVRPVL